MDNVILDQVEELEDELSADGKRVTELVIDINDINEETKASINQTLTDAGIVLYDPQNEDQKKLIKAKLEAVRHIQAVYFRPLSIMGLYLGGMKAFNSPKALSILVEAQDVMVDTPEDFDNLNNEFVKTLKGNYYLSAINFAKPDSTPEYIESIKDKSYAFSYTGEIVSYSAEIRAYTDFDGYYIDNEFLLNLTKGESTFISIHEILHNFLLHNYRTMVHPVFKRYKGMRNHYDNITRNIREGKLSRSYLYTLKWFNFNAAFKRESAIVNMALDQPINDIIQEEFKSIKTTTQPINIDRLQYTNDKFKKYIASLSASENKGKYVKSPLTLLESFIGSYVYEESLTGCTSEEAYDFFNKKSKRQKNALSKMNIDVQMSGDLQFDANGNPIEGSLEGEGNASASDHNFEGERREREGKIRQIAEQYKQIGGRSESFQKWYAEYQAEKSELDYRILLRNSILNLFKNKPTWSRLNSMLLPHEQYRPGVKGDHIIVNFVCDTSGSMGHYVEHTFPEIEKIMRSFKSYEVRFFAIDTDICGSDVFSSRKKFDYTQVQESLKGGGGTDYDAMWKHLQQTRNYHPVIFLTDFGVNLPQNKPVRNDVIWLAPKSTKSYSKDFEWGKIILIPDIKK